MLNLHNAGVLPEVIAMQLDMSNEEVARIISENSIQEQSKWTATIKAEAEPSLGMF